MLKLRKIAITGGVASGKSSVCKFFKELGAFVVEADAIVHELLDPSTDLGQQVVQTLGPEILENEKISRRIVAEKVFQSSKKLKQLEDLLHPAVLHRVDELYKQACKAGSYTLFVVEIPLLFEIKGESFFNQVVAVITDEPKAKERFEKLGFPKEEFSRRMKRQMDPLEKAKKANYILKNNGSLEDLRREVVSLNQKLQSIN